MLHLSPKMVVNKETVNVLRTKCGQEYKTASTNYLGNPVISACCSTRSGLHVVCNSMLQFVLLNISRSDSCITKVMFFSYKTNDKKEVFTTLSYLF